MAGSKGIARKLPKNRYRGPSGKHIEPANFVAGARLYTLLWDNFSEVKSEMQTVTGRIPRPPTVFSVTVDERIVIIQRCRICDWRTDLDVTDNANPAEEICRNTTIVSLFGVWYGHWFDGRVKADYSVESCYDSAGGGPELLEIVFSKIRYNA